MPSSRRPISLTHLKSFKAMTLTKESSRNRTKSPTFSRRGDGLPLLILVIWRSVSQNDGRPVGSPHPPRPHLGDERQQLPPQAEQAQTRHRQPLTTQS